MGLRRLRGRLDQVQGTANQTMAMAQDLIADLRDGVGVTISLDEGAAKTLAMMLLKGQGRRPAAQDQDRPERGRLTQGEHGCRAAAI